MPYDYKYDMFFLSYENYLFIKICKIVNSKKLHIYFFDFVRVSRHILFTSNYKACYIFTIRIKNKKKVYELPMYIYLANEINLSSRSTLQLIKTATN